MPGECGKVCTFGFYYGRFCLRCIFWILTSCPYHTQLPPPHFALEPDFFRNIGWGKRWGAGGHGDDCGDGGSDVRGGGCGGGDGMELA